MYNHRRACGERKVRIERDGVLRPAGLARGDRGLRNGAGFQHGGGRVARREEHLADGAGGLIHAILAFVVCGDADAGRKAKLTSTAKASVMSVPYCGPKAGLPAK